MTGCSYGIVAAPLKRLIVLAITHGEGYAFADHERAERRRHPTATKRNGYTMYVNTTWKSRPLTEEQTDRMMAIWGKMEADMAGDSSIERVCWFIISDGSGGLTVAKVHDADRASAFELETSLALSAYLELESKIVLDLEQAMPAILAGVARAKA